MWKAFGAFAVEYLGMPEEAMSLYSDGFRVRKKAAKIASFVMEVGNMGQSCCGKKPYVIRKALSMGRSSACAYFSQGVFAVFAVNGV